VAGDFYDELGVSRNATDEEIQQAYRRLARRYHPDVNHDPGAEDRFKDISEAYQVLSDPAQRKRYDRFGENFRQVPEGAEDAYQWAGAGRGGGFRGGGGGGTRVHFGQGAEDIGIDIDDLFGGFFRGRGGGGPIPGADQEAELVLSVEEAYHGGKRRITLGGRGERTYEVDIPQGVVDGQRIRLAGQGGHGTGNGPAGDLYLVVRIAPHPRYRLDGRDIHVDLPLTPWEGALGATVGVRTPGGQVKVRIAAGTSSGKKLRMRGEGMPNPRGKAGDLYAAVKIMVPPKPSARERELFEQLAAQSRFNPREDQ
jgi:curved DNA-binding protein